MIEEEGGSHYKMLKSYLSHFLCIKYNFKVESFYMDDVGTRTHQAEIFIVW